MIQITRDLTANDQYTLHMGEEMLMFVEKGVLSNIQELNEQIKDHAHCDLYNDMGCRMSELATIDQYGSLAAARDQGIYPVDCSEHLAYLYYSLSELMQALFQSRFLRSVRDAPKALPSRKAPVTADSIATFDADAGTWKPVDSSITDTAVLPAVDGPKHKLEKK